MPDLLECKAGCFMAVGKGKKQQQEWVPIQGSDLETGSRLQRQDRE